MINPAVLILTALLLSACQTVNMHSSKSLMLSHDSTGEVIAGSPQKLIAAIRNGCELTIGWGAIGASRTIEHIANPMWVSVRDGELVEAQLDDYLINLAVLGEPQEEHPRQARFGGTDEVLMWRANLKTDGSFNAVWYHPHTGKLVTRIPQQHPMKWFADCQPIESEALFPKLTEQK